MEIITIIACIFLAWLSKIQYKTRLNPLLFFTILWALVVGLSVPRLYFSYHANQYTYFIILIGIFGFALGSSFGKRIKIKDSPKHKLHYVILIILSIATIIFFAQDFARVISSFKTGGLAIVRALSQDSTSVLYEGKSALEIAIRSFIIEPFSLALQPMVACEFWYKNKRRWYFLIADLIIAVLRMLGQGSRSLFMYLGLNLIFAFLCINIGNRTLNEKITARLKKYKKYIVAIAVAFLVIFIWSSSSRSGNRLIRNLYYDFSMEPYLMQTWMGDIKSYGLGSASFNGFIYPLLFVVKNLFGFPTYPEPWYSDIFLLINDTDQIWNVIASDGTRANAYVSIFWFPYVDGGLLGEVIVMTFIGCLGAVFFKKYISNRDPFHLSLFLLFMQGIIMSFVRLQFATPAYALAFVFLYILYAKVIRISW